MNKAETYSWIFTVVFGFVGILVAIYWLCGSMLAFYIDQATTWDYITVIVIAGVFFFDFFISMGLSDAKNNIASRIAIIFYFLGIAWLLFMIIRTTIAPNILGFILSIVIPCVTLYFPFSIFGCYFGYYIGDLVGKIAEKKAEEKRKYEELKARYEQWKEEGYKVDELEEIIKRGSLSGNEHSFKEYETKIQRLKQLEIELNSLDIKEFHSEIISIKKKLKNPKKVDAVESELSSLKEKIKRKIENIFYETEDIIRNAIVDTTAVKDQIRLSALKLLQAELSSLFQKFEVGTISFVEAKAKILDLKQEAEILSIPTPDSEEEEISKETYYDILGVSRNASQDEIKEAYRKKIIKYHPDRISSWTKTNRVPEWVKKESDKMTKKLNKAYEILSDKNKRKQYDKTI